MKLLSKVSVKKFIAIITSLTFCYLALRGVIGVQEFMNVFLIVVTFYFSQSSMSGVIEMTKNMTETNNDIENK